MNNEKRQMAKSRLIGSYPVIGIRPTIMVDADDGAFTLIAMWEQDSWSDNH